MGDIRAENFEEDDTEEALRENNVVHDYNWVCEGARGLSSQFGPCSNALDQYVSDIGDTDDQCL